MWHRVRIAIQAEQVAERLVAASSVWLALLDRPEASTSRHAQETPRRNAGKAFGVDPEANPATQENQRELLRRSSNRPRLKRKRRLTGQGRSGWATYLPGNPMRLISLLICLAYWVLLSLLLLHRALINNLNNWYCVVKRIVR